MKWTWFLIAMGLTASSRAESWKFDMGPADSPVRGRYTGVAKDTLYDAQRGFGWKEPCEEDFNRTDTMYPQFGTTYTRAEVVEPANELLIDGVASKSDMTFRIDLPNGRYWVLALAGDLGAPTCRTALDANGRLVNDHLDAMTFRNRGGFIDSRIAGGVFRARFFVNVTDGKLEICFHEGIDRKDPYTELGMLNERARGRAGTNPLTAMPFSRNAVIGIEIYPCPTEKKPPLRLEEGRLVGDGRDANDFADAFNQQDYRTAVAVLRRPSFRANEPLSFAAASLWLAGRPEVEDYSEIVTTAHEVLAAILKESPDDPAVVDLHTSAWLFDTAMKLRAQKSKELGIEKMRSMEMVWVAEGMLRQLPQTDPLYYNARIEAARLQCGVDPNGHMETSYRGYKTFFELRERFPNNKYVALYLKGIPTIADRLVTKRYKELTDLAEEAEVRKKFHELEVPRKYDFGYEGAPDWAVELRDGLGWATEITEWWVKNRQNEEGGLNRDGWSDDCEMLRTWAPLASIGHSPVILEGATKLAEGTWNTPMMNRQWGIENGSADVEHITEMAGDTIPPMIYLHFGNPVYVERAMRTMRKIRDFFTDHDQNGDRLFRSRNVGVNWIDPDPHWALDTVYAQRLGLTGLLMIWYNGHPESIRVMREWADSWLKYARTTLQGKPEGILPLAIGFNTGKICFPEEDEWYKTPYNNPQTHDHFIVLNYCYNVLLELYAVTGDQKYLEPIERVFDLVQAYEANPVSNPPVGSAAWVGKSYCRGVSDFAPILVKHRMMTGETRFDSFIRERAGGAILVHGTLSHYANGPYARYLATGDKQYVEDGNKAITHLVHERRIEMVTSEVIMTDRGGLGNDEEQAPVGPMTGDMRGWGGMVPFYSVTWRGINRHFVALVTPLASNKQLKVLLYNFNPKPLDVEALLWRLDVGGEYRMTLGPDSNGDDMADSISSTREFKHEHRGDGIQLTVPSRKTMVWDIKRTKAGDNNFNVPDLAIAEEDIKYCDGKLMVTIHNIGNNNCGPFDVEIWQGEKESGKQLQAFSVNGLEAPNDLEPRTVTKSFRWVLPKWATRDNPVKITVVLDPAEEYYEITEQNNIKSRTLPYVVKSYQTPRT